MLMQCHPEVAYRSCEHCQAWMYEHVTGEISQRNGKPVRRPKGSKPACGYPGPYKDDKHPEGTGCAKVSPESNSSLTPDNQLCYQHYLECRAVSQFPDDAIVRRNAATIRRVEDVIEQMNVNRTISRMLRRR